MNKPAFSIYRDHVLILFFFVLVAFIVTWPLVLHFDAFLNIHARHTEFSYELRAQEKSGATIADVLQGSLPQEGILTPAAIPKLWAFYATNFWGESTHHGDAEEIMKWSDGTQFVYQMWSIRRAIREGRSPFHLPEIYAPYGSSLKGTPFVPTYTLLGILITSIFGVAELVAHNVFLILSITLSGFFMHLLAHTILQEKHASVFAGLLYATTPYLLFESTVGHTTYMQLGWIPLIFLATMQIMKGARPLPSAVLLGVVVGLQCLSAMQYFIYLTLFLPLFAFTNLPNCHIRFQDALKAVVVAILAFLVIAGWYLVAILMAEGSLVPRGLFEIRYYSLGTRYGFNLLKLWLNPIDVYAIGIVPLILMAAGFVRVLFNQKLREFLPFFILGLASLILAYGVTSERTPYALLYEFWPLWDMFRTPNRAYPFFLIPACLLAGAAWIKMRPNRFNRVLFLLCIPLVFLTHHALSPYLMSHCMTDFRRSAAQPIYDHIRDQSGAGIVFEMPLEFDPVYAYNVMRHGRHTVGGASGHAPKIYRVLNKKSRYVPAVNDPEIRDLLKAWNVRWIIFHSYWYEDWETIHAEIQKLGELRFVMQAGKLFLYDLEL